jgi:hypothetical protein
LDLTRGYDSINERYLQEFTLNMYLLGGFWFSPRFAFDDSAVKAHEMYEAQNVKSDTPIPVVGINTAAVLAKALSMLTGHRGIVF